VKAARWFAGSFHERVKPDGWKLNDFQHFFRHRYHSSLSRLAQKLRPLVEAMQLPQERPHPEKFLRAAVVVSCPRKLIHSSRMKPTQTQGAISTTPPSQN
jgi:hypothetical protein